MTMIVSITCDGCDYTAETSTDHDAGANEIDGVLDAGWSHDGGEDLCPKCVKPAEAAAAKTGGSATEPTREWGRRGDQTCGGCRDLGPHTYNDACEYSKPSTNRP